jgi:SAM-dependent methyltransferase
MRTEEMKRFWDERASEDAMYFVDNRLEYGDPDTERFWSGGRDDLDALLSALGADIAPTDEIVEIGCGVGRITRELATRGATVRAVDVSERMLELARLHNPELANVSWILGDGDSLAGIESESADACVSHVVFQHIPDPSITLSYIREIGRVLRPGGWAAFQISNSPEIHRRRPLGERLRAGARAALRRGPAGQAHPAWLGSAVELDDLRRAASDSGSQVARVSGEGTQFCFVLLHRRTSVGNSPL